MAVAGSRRRLSAGVELQPDGTAQARVWAPARRHVDFVLERPGEHTIVAMQRDAEGYFDCTVESARAGDRYWYRLDASCLRPDPVSRYQPDGPHGASQIVDPLTFPWTDAGWRGVPAEGQVIYEMHVGTFTVEGTWTAAAHELEELARLGITVIEMMPVNDFAGRFGWGYDGVNLYAPTRLYGVPDDLRRFVDRAHALGIGVILDVVYNHFGPDGNYLGDFSPGYFTDKYENDWGQALNFEGPRAARDFFVQNAAYWIDEFHFDGLRLDATQDIHDASPTHVVAEVVGTARAAAPHRTLYIVAENEPQNTRLVRAPSSAGHGVDALWNDDFHHTAVVSLTGRREAYYLDYTGSPQELVACAKYGFLYQGQWYAWQKKHRGTPALDLPGHAFVTFLENHDQVANTPFGARLQQVVSPASYRAVAALMLLGPGTPLLFQGQEFASSAPFLYFADHRDELRQPIRKGRAEFLAQFPSAADPAVQRSLPSPDDEKSFERSKLDFTERTAHPEAYVFHRDLLALRRSDPVIRAAAKRRPDGAVLGAHAFLLRFWSADGHDRLLLLNLGPDADMSPESEPLLAPPVEARWRLLWSSQAVEYGGWGRAPLYQQHRLHLPGQSALLLAPGAADEDARGEEEEEEEEEEEDGHGRS